MTDIFVVVIKKLISICNHYKCSYMMFSKYESDRMFVKLSVQFNGKRQIGLQDIVYSLRCLTYVIKQIYRTIFKNHCDVLVLLFKSMTFSKEYI